MLTFLGKEIPENIRGVLYLCVYNHTEKTIKVMGEILFESAFNALEAYANIPNPESLMASGADKESFETDLLALHAKINDPEWVTDLANYL